MNLPNAFIETYSIKEVNERVGTDSLRKDLFVYQGHEVPIQPRMFHPSRATHFALHLNLGKSIIFKYNLIEYHLQENSLFIIHPGIVHCLLVVENLPTISIGFTQEFFGASMAHKKNSESLGFLLTPAPPLFKLNIDEAKSIESMMVFLKKMIKNDHPFKEDMILHGFNLFVLEIAAINKKYNGSEAHQMTRKDDILFGFLKHLAAHFKEERSVQFYAGVLNITPKHLSKTVKELTTRNCVEFIDEMVISEAKILLGDLAYSVGQVANQLHFSDQFFFSKYFKRQTGISPKDYKSTI